MERLFITSSRQNSGAVRRQTSSVCAILPWSRDRKESTALGPMQWYWRTFTVDTLSADIGVSPPPGGSTPRLWLVDDVFRSAIRALMLQETWKSLHSRVPLITGYTRTYTVTTCLGSVHESFFSTHYIVRLRSYKFQR